MFHHKIVDIFKGLFPDLWENVQEWFPAGKGSIRMKLANRSELIFSYTNNKRWSLETIDLHTDRMMVSNKKK